MYKIQAQYTIRAEYNFASGLVIVSRLSQLKSGQNSPKLCKCKMTELLLLMDLLDYGW